MLVLGQNVTRGAQASDERALDSNEEQKHFEVVCHKARRGPFTMAMVWVTMVASFPAVLIGLEWHKQGFSLRDVLCALALNFAVLLAYSIPMCVLAARSGLSFKFLCHKYFGKHFSRLLTVCVLGLYLGWYSLTSLLMADACCGILGGKQYIVGLALTFSFAMALNNFFGFKGVANFARFVGAPAVICWIVFMFIKVAPDVPHYLSLSGAAAGGPQVSLPLVFCGVSQSILGYVMWGNEADYWRNSASRVRGIACSLAFALFIGAVIFPLTGWLVGARTGITEPSMATDYLNKFAFGGAGILALLFLAAQYFACNDSNLYAFAHAAESFTKISHKKAVLILAILAGGVASLLAVSGTQNALFAVCALNGVILPTASVLILSECLLLRRIAKNQEQITPAKWSAIVAWSSGMLFGVITSGIIPGTDMLKVPMPIISAWLLTLCVFWPVRALELTRSKSFAMAVEA